MEEDFEDFWYASETCLIGMLNILCNLNIMSEDEYFNTIGEIEDGTFFMMVFYTLRNQNIM